jgi:uncharacterized membrane protein
MSVECISNILKVLGGISVIGLCGYRIKVLRYCGYIAFFLLVGIIAIALGHYEYRMKIQP